MTDLSHVLCNDTYVFTMYGTGSSKCYIKITYNMSRSGNTMYYTIRVGARMGDTGSFCYIPWWITPSYWNGSSWISLGEKKVKNYGAYTIGRTWFYSDWSFSRNINEANTEIRVTWRGRYDDGTGQVTWLSNRSMGYTSYITPSSPNNPSSVYIPSSTPPDRTVNISWSASSGGSNGVSGYQAAYSNNGGTNWSYLDCGSTNFNLNLNNAGFVHGSVLRAAVRSYSVVNGVRYYSPWSFSGNTTTLFVAPSAPRNLSLVFNTEEPIPTATYTASWQTPTNLGSNGVSGYTFKWLKTGANYGNEVDVNSLSKSITLTEGNYNVGDTISFQVRAYTVGQNNRYYSDYSTSGYITIVSDKYIFLSLNGGTFEKRKMYVSVNGGTFKEVKKNKFKLI